MHSLDIGEHGFQARFIDVFCYLLSSWPSTLSHPVCASTSTSCNICHPVQDRALQLQKELRSVSPSFSIHNDVGCRDAWSKSGPISSLAIETSDLFEFVPAVVLQLVNSANYRAPLLSRTIARADTDRAVAALDCSRTLSICLMHNGRILRFRRCGRQVFAASGMKSRIVFYTARQLIERRGPSIFKCYLHVGVQAKAQQLIRHRCAHLDSEAVNR